MVAEGEASLELLISKSHTVLSYEQTLSAVGRVDSEEQCYLSRCLCEERRSS